MEQRYYCTFVFGSEFLATKNRKAQVSMKIQTNDNDTQMAKIRPVT